MTNAYLLNLVFFPHTQQAYTFNIRETNHRKKPIFN